MYGYGLELSLYTVHIQCTVRTQCCVLSVSRTVKSCLFLLFFVYILVFTLGCWNISSYSIQYVLYILLSIVSHGLKIFLSCSAWSAFPLLTTIGSCFSLFYLLKYLFVNCLSGVGESSNTKFRLQQCLNFHINSIVHKKCCSFYVTPKEKMLS